MASKTFSEHVIVLQKTKLKESDLIITFLAADGRKLKAVAKGARKPSGSFASRLELYSASRVLCVEGRNLHIVKEARILDAHASLRSDLMKGAAANLACEYLSKVIQEDLEVPRLFDMTESFLAHLERADETRALLLTAAFLLKVAALLGLRPCVDVCVECGMPPQLSEPDAAKRLFSFEAGGVLCGECRGTYPVRMLPTNLIEWVRVLLASTFDEVAAFECDESTQLSLVRFAAEWAEYHMGVRMKGLSFLASLVRLSIKDDEGLAR